VLDVAQVLSLMWLRTTVNYQVQYAMYNTAFINPAVNSPVVRLQFEAWKWLTSYRQYLSWQKC